jgi:hypothetical protein
MIEFLMANMETVGMLIAALIILVYAIATKQWATVRTVALSFMLSAERLMATEEGKAKMEFVLTAVWDQVPGWVKRFYDKNKLRLKLQEWYDIAKDMLK